MCYTESQTSCDSESVAYIRSYTDKSACVTIYAYVPSVHACMHACLHAPAIKGTTILSTQQIHKTDFPHPTYSYNNYLICVQSLWLYESTLYS